MAPRQEDQGRLRLITLYSFCLPQEQSPQKQHRRRNLLVYLHHGPTLAVGTRDTAPRTTSFGDIFSSHFQASLPPETSIASINYQLGESAVFPTPIHEVTTAFDYLTSSTSPFNADQDEAPRICLLGSHIGGALATMLALTEPNTIHGMVVVEPLVDWVGLDEVVEQLQTPPSTSSGKSQAQKQAQRQAQKSKSKSGNRFSSDEIQSVLVYAQELLKLRSKLFMTPSAYFDPFASPMLFLRAPGRDTPLATTVGDQLVNEMGLDDVDSGYGEDGSDSFGPYDDDLQQPSPPTVTSSAASSEMSGQPTILTMPTPPRRRKVLRRWPSVGFPEDVSLPRVKIFVTEQTQPTPPSPRSEGAQGINATDGVLTPEINLVKGHAALMRTQGLEMAELMRRACFISREKSYAEEMVQIQLCGQHGSQTGEALDMQTQAVRWISDVFAQE